MSAQELIEQTLRLPAADRAEVAAEMLFSLSPDESLDANGLPKSSRAEKRRRAGPPERSRHRSA